MARYDLMHWSQRVRDQQAAARAAQPPPSVLPTPVRQPAKPRASRPKPPRDEEADQLLRLCRDGRLFELQAWVAAGKSLSVPAHYRQTPMRIALNTGFHSLIEFLLRHEENQSVKDDVLRQACWSGQRSVMQLALNHGASIGGVSFQSVIETWDRGVAQLFLEHGADPVTNAPFARAFKARVKAVLGIFLDCRRARPDVAEALQAQADMALRQACQDEDLKWVSLLMWLGANPRAKGLATDDLDTPDAVDSPEYQQSALQIACGSKEPKILKRLKPDPATDDLRELMAAAASLITTPETVAYPVSLGADVNDKSDGGSTVLETCLRNFAWRETVWEASYPYRHSTVSASRLGKSLDALGFLLEKGARWTPDDRAIADTRRALYRVDGEGIAAVVKLLRTHHACDDNILTALVRTEKMRNMLAEANRQRAGSERLTKRMAERKTVRPESPSPAKPTPARLPPSRYERQRLYEEVGSEPTQQVAKRYGVSDVAIAKACALLAIPKPPRGYWAKKAADRNCRIGHHYRFCVVAEVWATMRHWHRRSACELLPSAISTGSCRNIPPCDLLIVAGDVCPDRFGPFMAVHDPYQQQAWFDRTVRPWLAATPATHKLLTWGNHDWCGQVCSFSSDTPVHARSTDLQILVDEGTSVPSAAGTGGELSVWATPWSNPFMRWAFMKPPSDLERVYAAIPDGIDILVSHQPPYGYGDSTFDLDSRRVEHVGSRELLVAIERVRPRVVICGHVHGGFGRYEHQDIPIYNVSVVDESYRLVNVPTVIDLPGI